MGTCLLLVWGCIIKQIHSSHSFIELFRSQIKYSINHWYRKILTYFNSEWKLLIRYRNYIKLFSLKWFDKLYCISPPETEHGKLVMLKLKTLLRKPGKSNFQFGKKASPLRPPCVHTALAVRIIFEVLLLILFIKNI